MKKHLLPIVAVAFLLFSCDSKVEEIVTSNTAEFPNIDNTHSMGVSTTLAAPTETNLKLDSMKMFYYEDYSSYSTNILGMQYKTENKTTPVNPFLMEVKHSFSYADNGFVDIRTVEVNNHDWNSNTFKFVFDYDYDAQNQLNNVKVNMYVNDKQVVNQNLEYASANEQEYLNQMQLNEYNIVKYRDVVYSTPKNVYNPERNLLPANVKLQYLGLFSSEIYGSSYEDLLELIEEYFTVYNYINSHATFLKEIKNTNGFVVPSSNIQYKVREDHYPEIIQYGNVKTGGYRFLYYYKK